MWRGYRDTPTSPETLIRRERVTRRAGTTSLRSSFCVSGQAKPVTARLSDWLDPFSGLSGCQGLPLICPLEGTGQRCIEVIDELLNALAQFVERGKACPPERFSGENGEPYFDLIEPHLRFWDAPNT